MKKLLPILLLTSLLLSACSIDWNDEKEKKIAELEKEIVELEQKQEDVIFEKNKECSKLEKEIWSQLNSSKTSEDDTIHLEVIFYSPIRKSCLYKTDVMYSSL